MEATVMTKCTKQKWRTGRGVSATWARTMLRSSTSTTSRLPVGGPILILLFFSRTPSMMSWTAWLLVAALKLRVSFA